MEILYGWERNKLVVAVNPKGMMLSPWIVYHSHRIFSDYDVALEFIEDWWAGKRKKTTSPLMMVAPVSV